MKKITSLLLALLLYFSLAGCSNDPAATTATIPGDSMSESTASDGTSDGGKSTIVVGSITNALRNASWDLSPWRTSGSSGNTMWPQLYSCLMANPAYGTPLDDMHYDMAESISFSDDKLTATIKIRDYIHDSKGNPIKAQDVVFSYNTAPRVAPVMAVVDTLLESITDEDELTVVMKLYVHSPGSWERLLSYMPIVSQSWYESASDEERANDPATTGAYRVLENNHGHSVILEALDNFWQKDELRSAYQIANVRTIRHVAIVEDSMRVIAMETGEIDMAIIENNSIRRFMNNPDYSVFEYYMTVPAVYYFNCSENSIFYEDPNLRKAVLHAIDFEQVRIAHSGDFGFRNYDIASAKAGDYDPAWENQPYFDFNPELAKQFLDNSGYDGREIRFMCRNITGQVAAVTVFQSNLRDIGIDLVIDAYDQALFNTYLPDPTEWDIVWGSAAMVTGFVLESWNYYYGVADELGTVGFVQDARLQELLDIANINNNSATRNAFRDYTLEQAYAVGAYTEPGYVVTRKEIVDLPISFLAHQIVNASVVSEVF